MSNNTHWPIHFDLHANDDEIPKNKVNTVTIYPPVTTIRKNAFYRRDQLQSVVIPNSITTIGDCAFHECSRLSSLTLSNSITTIGSEAFWGCYQLTSLTLPKSITTIGDCAFHGCFRLSSLTLPNSITTIGRGAFDGCLALEQRLPNGLNNNADTVTWLRQRFNNLPLHQSVYNITTLTTTLLSNLIEQHRSTLTTTDAMGMTPLHVLCGNLNVESLEMAQILTDAEPDIALRRSVTGHTPLMMLMHVDVNPYDYPYYHEEDGELKLLPLVRLLKKKLNYDALEAALVLHKRQLMPEIDVEDEASGLLPFMYAASLMECSLGDVYQLAIQRPDLLCKNIIEDNDVSNSRAKRQKLE